MAGWRNRPLVGTALVAVSLALASCGGSSGTSGGGGTTAAASPTPVGKSIRIPASGTKLVVTVRKVIFPLRGSGILLLPGESAAGVQVSVHNTGPGIYDSSSESDVRLETTSGQPAEPGFAPHGHCTTSEIDFLKEVQRGESRSGCVAFGLPRKAKPAKVRFAPEGRIGLARTWVVKG